MKFLIFLTLICATITANKITHLPAYGQNAIPSGPPEPPLDLTWPKIIQPISFHIIHKSDGTGMVSNKTIVNQVYQLNNAFSGNDAKKKGYSKPTDANINFVLNSIDYTENDEWFDNCALWNYQPTVKKALFKSGNYNVYVCSVASNLGLSIIPFQIYSVYGSTESMPLPEDHWYLGSLIHYTLLTGSTVFNGRWSQGLILVHETGHHYGLNHLYQGGCISDETASDNIADTPRQVGNPSSSCRKLRGHDSCPKKPGKDDNSNYMSINFDLCRSHFTPGQVSYFRHIISSYKPKLASNTG